MSLRQFPDIVFQESFIFHVKEHVCIPFEDLHGNEF